VFSLEHGECLQFGGLGYVVETTEESPWSLCVHGHGVGEVTHPFTQAPAIHTVISVVTKSVSLPE
jgi:hypothetical protein